MPLRFPTCLPSRSPESASPVSEARVINRAYSAYRSTYCKTKSLYYKICQIVWLHHQGSRSTECLAWHKRPRQARRTVLCSRSVNIILEDACIGHRLHLRPLLMSMRHLTRSRHVLMVMYFDAAYALVCSPCRHGRQLPNKNVYKTPGGSRGLTAVCPPAHQMSFFIASWCAGHVAIPYCSTSGSNPS